MSMKYNRRALVRSINAFVGRYSDTVQVLRYSTTDPLEGSPYRQRARIYAEPVDIKCAILELRNTEIVGMTGGMNLRRFDVCTSPESVLQAFHPNDYDDPRVKRDPALLFTERDALIVRGVRCKIIAVERHGDDGNGPVWYLFSAKQDIE